MLPVTNGSYTKLVKATSIIMALVITFKTNNVSHNELIYCQFIQIKHKAINYIINLLKNTIKINKQF